MQLKKALTLIMLMTIITTANALQIGEATYRPGQALTQTQLNNTSLTMENIKLDFNAIKINYHQEYGEFIFTYDTIEKQDTNGNTAYIIRRITKALHQIGYQEWTQTKQDLMNQGATEQQAETKRKTTEIIKILRNIKLTKAAELEKTKNWQTKTTQNPFNLEDFNLNNTE